MKAIAGRQGNENRSDCYFEVITTRKGGIQLEVKSKVDSMYGESIRRLIFDMCEFFEIKNLKIYLEDYGALPFTLAARFELAIKRLYPEIGKEYLLPFNLNSKYGTSRERFRRSRLYLPGNQPKLFINAGLHKPDGIILDLEDSVSPLEKDAAQLLVRNALRSVDFYGAERMVRINQLPKGLEDLKYVVPHNVHVILIPKCETAEDVLAVKEETDKLRKANKIRKKIYLMPIIESAKGVLNVYKIASSTEDVCAVAIGLEDYTADIGAQRTNEGRESFYARTALVNAAKAAGVQAIDTVFSDVNDMEGLRQSVVEAKSLGFDGKGCIHPRQIKVVHDAFAPSEEEIEKAKKIVAAFEEAKAKGLGVVSLGSKMIDPPVVKRAINVLKYLEN